MEDIKIKKSFKSIDEVPVWLQSHSLTLKVYEVTKFFPKSELFGLVSQLRRSSSPIPANITEGFYRNSTKELIQFLYMARGSLGETIYHIRLAFDLGYMDEKDLQLLMDGYNDVGKQLNGWIKSLKARSAK